MNNNAAAHDTNAAGEASLRGAAHGTEPVALLTVLVEPGDAEGVLRDLVARIQALLGADAGSRATAAGRDAAGGATVTRVDELCIDHGAYRVTVGGEEVLLTSLEFKLLATLVERRDRVQPRSTLLRDVWGSRGEYLTRTVDTHVSRLREKLGSAGRFIHTIRSAGYRFSDVPTSQSWRRAPAAVARLRLAPPPRAGGV